MKPEDPGANELKKLLQTKQYELPPRTYFDRFAEQVGDRLRKPEPAPDPTWWQRLGLDFDTKPVLVCAAGAGVCGLLVYGIIASTRVEPPPPGPSAQSLPGSPVAGQLDAPAAGAPHIARPDEMPRGADPALAADASTPNPFTVRPKTVSFKPDASRAQ